MNQYEIFTTEGALNTKSTAIDILLGYPNAATKTDRYRDVLKHDILSSWAGVVDQNLVDACASMTPTDRLQYYDDTDLKDRQYLIDNGWFPPFTE